MKISYEGHLKMTQLAWQKIE